MKVGSHAFESLDGIRSICRRIVDHIPGETRCHARETGAQGSSSLSLGRSSRVPLAIKGVIGWMTTVLPKITCSPSWSNWHGMLLTYGPASHFSNPSVRLRGFLDFREPGCLIRARPCGRDGNRAREERDAWSGCQFLLGSRARFSVSIRQCPRFAV